MQFAKYVKFREEKFGGVLFQTQSERVFTLNQAAAAVVQEVRPGHDADSIVVGMKKRFRDPAGTLETDVKTLLGALRSEGLIVDDAP
jgi:hypothetical protein